MNIYTLRIFMHFIYLFLMSNSRVNIDSFLELLYKGGKNDIYHE